MAKNYADIYNAGNVAIAIDQRFYVKQEVTRGELIAPTNTDFFYAKAGGSVEFMQEIESSPHRSGRHHNNYIKKKKTCTWSFPTYFNIDTSLGAASSAEIEPAQRVLFKSLCGYEDSSAGLEYKITTPSTTFSIFEVGDKWARQVRGGFVQSGTMTFPGDGEAGVEWSGTAKDAIYLGLGKSTVDNTGGNTITLEAGEGDLFKAGVGGMVMLIEADGLTRSADTPVGSPRKIVSVLGDVVTLDGVALADADGSGLGAPIYLVYYEPDAPAGIDNPVTGLTGSFQLTSVGSLCARNVTITITNDHEEQNYCYGSDSLSGKMFIPGSKCTVAVSFEANLDEKTLKLLNYTQGFESQVAEIILGDALGRHLDINFPKLIFDISSPTVPDTGSIPITFNAKNAFQTALDAGDEISIYFK